MVGPIPDKDRIAFHLVDGSEEMHLSEKNTKHAAEWIDDLTKIVNKQKGNFIPSGEISRNQDIHATSLLVPGPTGSPLGTASPARRTSKGTPSAKPKKPRGLKRSSTGIYFGSHVNSSLTLR